MQNIKKIGLSLAVVSALGLGFVGCGGGGSSAPTETTQTGYFIDSGIVGMPYTTSSGLSGVTEENGKYSFKPNDTISFLDGKFGSEIQCKEYLTPLDIFDDNISTFEANDKVTNYLRVLQTIDKDGDPSNGLDIADNISTFKDKEKMDFNDTLTVEANIGSWFGTLSMVSKDSALRHYKETHTLKESGLIEKALTNDEIKIFNRYLGTYFSGEKILIDNKNIEKLEFAKSVANAVNGVADYIEVFNPHSTKTKTLTDANKIKMITATKEVLKDILTHYYASADETTINTSIDVVAKIIEKLATTSSSTFNGTKTSFDTMVDELVTIGTLTAQQSTQNIKDIAYISLQGYNLYKNVHTGNVGSLLQQAINATTDGLLTGYNELVALSYTSSIENNINLPYDFLVAYYASDKDLTKTTQKLGLDITSGDIGTIIDALATKREIGSGEYSAVKVLESINTFNSSFEKRYKLYTDAKTYYANPLTYSWITSSYGSCVGDCGTDNGTQTRTVTCKDSDGNSADDIMCTDTKPSLTQSCTASDCGETINSNKWMDEENVFLSHNEANNYCANKEGRLPYKNELINAYKYENITFNKFWYWYKVDLDSQSREVRMVDETTRINNPDEHIVAATRCIKD